MKFRGIYSILIVFLFLLSGCGNKQFDKISFGDQPHVEADNKEAETIKKRDLIKEKIDNMTLDEKIGQLIIAGFDGITLDDNTKSLINDDKIGGIILFSENVESVSQLVNLTNSIKSENSSNKIPMFISVDEEGGSVSRMPKEIRRFPSNRIIGDRNNEKLSYNIGKMIGEEIYSFGFNMNYAPVLDINSNPNNKVIGNRSFGNNVEVVSRLGIQTMKGLMDSNIISVVKHFPGHGDTSIDSHISLPVVENDLERLNSFEFIPFKKAIENGVDAIMVSHILLTKIDKNNPATISKAVVSDILRGDLGFDGVVITDDMTMGAITQNYSIENAAINSINAGTDIILVCHQYKNIKSTIEAIKKAVNVNKTISEERINESVYRILKLKEKYNLSGKLIEIPDISSINNDISNIID